MLPSKRTHTVPCQVLLRVGAHICCTSLMRCPTFESHTGHSMQDACSSAITGLRVVSHRELVAADQRNSRVLERGLHTATQPRTDIWVLTDVGSERCLAPKPASPSCGAYPSKRRRRLGREDHPAPSPCWRPQPKRPTWLPNGRHKASSWTVASLTAPDSWK